MSDIVDELRYGHEAATLWHVCREAADTIEALRAENAKLRQAMHEIYEVYAGSDSTGPERYWQERIQEMAYIAGKHKRAGDSDE